MTSKDQALKTLGDYFGHSNPNAHEWNMIPYHDAYIVSPANNKRANPYIIRHNKITVLLPTETVEQAYERLKG